jgi:hypothetical protein
MAKRTAKFSGLIWGASLRLTLLTTMVLGVGETGVPCRSLAQVEAGIQDIPEEMLQTQITTEANSPLTGLAQSASSSAKEQKQLRVTAAEVPPRLSPSIYRAVELLRLRKLLKSLLPFF